MQKKSQRRWPFTKKDTNTVSQGQTSPSSSTIILSEWCQTIYDTPLYKFVEAFVDGNLSALVKQGNPLKEDLETAWQNILAEYSEAVGPTEHKLYLQLLKQTSSIKITLQQVDELIKTLRNYYAKPFADMLNKLVGSSYVFDPSRDDYDKNLDRCKMRSKGFLIELNLKEAQLKSLESKLGANNQKPDRLYFEHALISLSDHAHFHLSDQIMTSEFCTRLNRFTKYIDSQPKSK